MSKTGRPKSPTPRSPRRARFSLAVVLILALLAAAVFGQVAGHAFLNYDDASYVTRNPWVMNGLTTRTLSWAFTSFYAVNWHPITWLSHALDVQLFGLRPGPHHLVNVFLHAANATLLFLVLSKMTGILLPSALVATLFLIHPLHVESVAWVAERKDVLSALFFMLTLAAWLRYVHRRSTSRYLLAILVFALGLMSKPMLVTLPFVLLLLDFWPLARWGRIAGPGVRPSLFPGAAGAAWLLAEKVPFLMLSAGSSIITYLAQQKGNAIILAYPLGFRISNALVSMVTYLEKTVWPAHLAFLYPYPNGIPAWKMTGAALILGCFSALAVGLAGRWPFLAVGWLWYLGTLVPVLGLVHVGQHASADRYTYIPLIGIFIAVAWSLPGPGSSQTRRGIAAVVSVVALAVLSVTSFLQVGHWRTNITLFGHGVAVTRENFIAENNLGNALALDGRLDEAVAHYRAAIRIYPWDLKARTNLGLTLISLGRTAAAVAEYQEVLRLSPGHPAALSGLQQAARAGGRTVAPQPSSTLP